LAPIRAAMTEDFSYSFPMARNNMASSRLKSCPRMSSSTPLFASHQIVSFQNMIHC